MEIRVDEIDAQAFRVIALELLAKQVPPAEVHWVVVEPPVRTQGPAVQGLPVHSVAANSLIPNSFIRSIDTVILHRDKDRHSLLYRLLWRLMTERQLKNDVQDGDLRRAAATAQAVRQEANTLRRHLAFIRIGHGASETRCAWVSPVHHTLEHVTRKAGEQAPSGLCLLASPNRLARWRNGFIRSVRGEWAMPTDSRGWQALMTEASDRPE